MTDEAQRLSKAVMALAGCSRREAEQFITAGRVTVDGRKVEEPQFRVTPSQQVAVDAQAALPGRAGASFVLHKPAGMGTGEARSLLPGAQRTIALLELPPPASGLSVFSEDRGIVRKLQDDPVEQELVAELAQPFDDAALARVGQGWQGVKVSRQSEARLRLAGKGLRAEDVPLRCDKAGLRLVALRRIRLGRIALAGLPPGQWRQLEPGERF